MPTLTPVAIYWERGESVDYLNTGSTLITYGDVIPFGADRIGVAGCDIPPGAMGSMHLIGVFKIPKASGAIAIGAAVYYNAANKQITTTDTGNTPAGFAVVAAASGDALALVKIG